MTQNKKIEGEKKHQFAKQYDVSVKPAKGLYPAKLTPHSHPNSVPKLAPLPTLGKSNFSILQKVIVTRPFPHRGTLLIKPVNTDFLL